VLQWIGVQSATRAFSAQMAEWNDTVPFFISLRRYVGRELAETGDPAVLPALARFGSDPRKPVVQELVRAWSLFDVEEYARTVLPEYPVRDEWFRVDDLNLLPALRHLRRLRSLMVKAPQDSVVPLGFVRDLPDLTGLHLNLADDLTPLRDSRLENLIVWSPRVDSAVSLDPLINLDTRTWICVDRAVGDFAALSRLPLLTGLLLDRLHTMAAAGSAARTEPGTAARAADQAPAPAAAGSGSGAADPLRPRDRSTTATTTSTITSRSRAMTPGSTSETGIRTRQTAPPRRWSSRGR
jgi:hypothetical protein